MGMEPSPHIIDDAEIRRKADEHGLDGNLALADALRDMLDRVARSSAPAEKLMRISTAIRQSVGLLDECSEQLGYLRSVEGRLTGLANISELGPFTGRLHACSAKFTIILREGRAEARAVYGAAHEGAPGLLQGGFIAGAFDEMLGVVQSGVPRMTVELLINYRAPAPLHRELRYSAWVDRIEGRKAFTCGTLHEGDQLLAEAKALFIAPRPGVLPKAMADAQASAAAGKGAKGEIL